MTEHLETKLEFANQMRGKIGVDSFMTGNSEIQL